MELLPYRPHLLLRSGHLQTLMVGVLFGWRPPYAARQISIPLEDNDALIAHEELAPPAIAKGFDDSTPLNILIHGLGGDHSSPYLQRIAYRMAQRGQRVWRVDLRGSGAGLDLAWRPPHAGSSEDLASVVRAACQHYPLAPIRIVGFSLSGNIVLKMLGEAAAGALRQPVDFGRISSALAIAPPVDLHLCAANMERFSRKVYTRFYLRVLDGQVETRRARWPQWNQIARQPSIRTIREFDERYTAPLSGFANAAEYYTRASAKPWLQHIQTPTTLLIDRNDPIVDLQAFDALQLNSDTTRTVHTKLGGHMGYFGRDSQGKLLRWMEHYVEHHLLDCNSSSNHA
ncbi:putative hydrolase [Aureliella helgolandensis]|uniref:Putative hydrolase n=2 Tax=Aureliella helgolandensis TaxID=2527968 RepID=A0A518GG11_9BACT|nr:putative hydrolase [Aureliella helgolandensis]